MKRGIIATAIILMIPLTSCQRSGHDDYSKIYESYGNIENYSADIEVNVVSGGSRTEYFATQYYMSPDLYRVDYKSEGMENASCVLNGDKLRFKDSEGTVSEFSGYIPEEKYYIFITDFMERYYKSEMAESTFGKNEVILSLLEDGENSARPLMKLWVNSKTFAPKKLITYNDNGDEIIIVTYQNFKMNTKMDKKIFDM